jgi:hypothetical protein
MPNFILKSGKMAVLIVQHVRGLSPVCQFWYLRLASSCRFFWLEEVDQICGGV